MADARAMSTALIETASDADVSVSTAFQESMSLDIRSWR